MSEVSTIGAILNCYAPASGANIAQVVLRTGGAVEIHGDEDLARHVLAQFAKTTLPPPAPRRADHYIKFPRRRPRAA